MREIDDIKKNDAQEGNKERGGTFPQTGAGETVDKQPLRWSILRIIAAIVLTLAVIATAAILFVSIKTYYSTSKQTDGYFARAATIENDIKTNLPRLNDKFALERLDSFFTKDEVYSFAYNLWQYELQLNGKAIPSTETLTIAPGDELSIKESLDETMLPPEFLAYGNLTRGDVNDSLKNHFSLNKKTYILNEKKDKLSTIYKVEDLSLEKGESFNLLLSVQLQERLDFERDVIVVTVK
ncbi:MAG TPA: hypothetical protein VFD23_00545 [Clostridia bacterium]|nr:hypothetical protein [Clostridia bacterium]